MDHRERFKKWLVRTFPGPKAEREAEKVIRFLERAVDDVLKRHGIPVKKRAARIRSAPSRPVRRAAAKV